LERTLEAMEMLLGEQLAEALPDTIDGASTVLPFHSNK
jgi:hypothetical protein